MEFDLVDGEPAIVCRFDILSQNDRAYYEKIAAILNVAQAHVFYTIDRLVPSIIQASACTKEHVQVNITTIEKAIGAPSITLWLYCLQELCGHPPTTASLVKTELLGIFEAHGIVVHPDEFNVHLVRIAASA